MRPPALSLLPILLLGACAPKAEVVAEAPQPKPRQETRVADPEPLPDPDPGIDDGMIGGRIDRLPSQEEMRPSVNTADNGGLIARPPTGGKPPATGE